MERRSPPQEERLSDLFQKRQAQEEPPEAKETQEHKKAPDKHIEPQWADLRCSETPRPMARTRDQRIPRARALGELIRKHRKIAQKRAQRLN